MSQKDLDDGNHEGAEPKPVHRRIGFLDGKYPPMSLEDFNAFNDEIASWFYEGSLFPDNPQPEK